MIKTLPEKRNARSSASLDMLKIEMFTRHISSQDLAKRLGYNTRTIRNVLCGNDPSISLRRKIEKVLGKQFWPDLPSPKQSKERDSHAPNAR